MHVCMLLELCTYLPFAGLLSVEVLVGWVDAKKEDGRTREENLGLDCVCLRMGEGELDDWLVG